MKISKIPKKSVTKTQKTVAAKIALLDQPKVILSTKHVDSRVSRPHVGDDNWKEFVDFIYKQTGQLQSAKALKPAKQIKLIEESEENNPEHWINQKGMGKKLLGDIMHYRNTSDQQ